MKKFHWIVASLIWLACSTIAPAQTPQPDKKPRAAQAGLATTGHPAEAASLDPQREKHALQVFLKIAQEIIVSAADAMPADKYPFAPTDGEFKGVRTFGQQVKHLAAANYILSAAALGEEPPADAGDETGPEAVRAKAEILDYLNGSF